MSSSPPGWVDPHFAALYARREEERLAERLVTRMRERAALEPFPDLPRTPELRESGARARRHA